LNISSVFDSQHLRRRKFGMKYYADWDGNGKREGQNPKSEIRNPNENPNPKSEKEGTLATNGTNGHE